MNTTTFVPSVPKSLGYAGLLPFLALSIGLWVIPQQYTHEVTQALLAYGAVILSFMGAIHWGAAIDLVNKKQQKQLAWSVLPSLVAWLALLVPVIYGYFLLIIAFAMLCVLDSIASKQKIMPPWYPQLRIPLTTVVITCLVIALLAITVK